MKNCLIVLVYLVACFCMALFLTFYLNGPRSYDGRKDFAGEWGSYEEGGRIGLTVGISQNNIRIFLMPEGTRPQEIKDKGRWSMHAFHVDSHLDSPTEVVVARELKNEDLEFDLGHYVPGKSKVTLVMMMRGGTTSPYPVYKNNDHVTYPPPRGLIRPGMLQWDLDQLPWHSERIEIQQDSSQVYNYHSDRPDATALLVTVDKGKVIKVTGGAEDTADVPYRFPSAPPEEEKPAEDDHKDRSWGGWLFDLMFRK